MDVKKQVLHKYSGTSHTLLVLLPPAVGYLASLLFVVVGPFYWWVNWLIAGLVWGISLPLRKFVRSSLKYTTHEFRSNEVSWWSCVRYEFASNVQDWREEPGKMTSAWLGITLLESFGWPILIPLGAMVWGSLDHG